VGWLLPLLGSAVSHKNNRPFHRPVTDPPSVTVCGAYEKVTLYSYALVVDKTQVSHSVATHIAPHVEIHFAPDPEVSIHGAFGEVCLEYVQAADALLRLSPIDLESLLQTPLERASRYSSSQGAVMVFVQLDR